MSKLKKISELKKARMPKVTIDSDSFRTIDSATASPKPKAIVLKAGFDQLSRTVIMTKLEITR
jgi:hypothetical protein